MSATPPHPDQGHKHGSDCGHTASNTPIMLIILSMVICTIRTVITATITAQSKSWRRFEVAD